MHKFPSTEIYLVEMTQLGVVGDLYIIILQF